MDCPAWYSKCQQFQDIGEGFFAWILKNRLERYPDFYICYKSVSSDYSYKIWEISDNYFCVFFVLRNFKFCWVSNKNAPFK